MEEKDAQQTNITLNNKENKILIEGKIINPPLSEGKKIYSITKRDNYSQISVKVYFDKEEIIEKYTIGDLTNSTTSEVSKEEAIYVASIFPDKNDNIKNILGYLEGGVGSSQNTNPFSKNFLYSISATNSLLKSDNPLSFASTSISKEEESSSKTNSQLPSNAEKTKNQIVL